MLIKIGKQREPIIDTSNANKDYFVIHTIVARIKDKFSLWISLGKKHWKLDEGTRNAMLWKKQRVDKFLNDYKKFPLSRQLSDVIQIAARL